MLILTRRKSEKVMIGADVTVTVLSVQGDQVRIGVNAPKDVTVRGEEGHEQIKRGRRSRPASRHHRELRERDPREP